MFLALGGCSTEPRKPSVVYVPETVGIVVRIDTAGPGTTYVLADGRLIAVDPHVRLPGTSDPGVGDLLLSGTEAATWLHGLRALDPKPVPDPADCYGIVGNTWTSPTHVMVAVHDALLGDGLIVFPKAPEWADFEYFHVAGSDRLMGVYNCINEHGQILEHRFGQ